MNAQVIFRSITSAVIAATAILSLAKTQGSLSLGELLIVALSASILTSGLGSLVRSPSQFFRAVFERIRYAILVPTCISLLIGLFCFRIAFIILKLSIKGLLALTLWFLYLISPIDLMPDFIPILGQIDDIMLLVTIVVWLASGEISKNLRASIAIHRPTTPFP